MQRDTNYHDVSHWYFKNNAVQTHIHRLKHVVSLILKGQRTQVYTSL